MRKRIAPKLAIALLVIGLGAAQGPTSSGSVSTQSNISHGFRRKPTRSKPYQVGTASWYGSDFHGKATASGEPYDMYDFTAAHPTLPIGSWVRVTNLRNGRAVVLRINDRGPSVPGRIIDVSYSAARALEFKARGIQQVRLDVVQPQTLAMLRQ